MEKKKRKTWTLTTTQKLERSRETTKRLTARELWSGIIFARLWPSYLTPTAPENKDYPRLLCIDSPAGLLVYRISTEEQAVFKGEDWIATRSNCGEKADDRTPVLMALAAGGWPGSRS